MTRRATRTSHPVTCDPRTGVTRSPLGYGLIAGPLYAGAWLTTPKHF